MTFLIQGNSAVTAGAAIAFAVLAYLLGSIPFALILGRMKGVDIRAAGSGNIGATNLGRVLGRRYGFAAFALDFLKGLLPVMAVGWLSGQSPEEGGVLREHAMIACALAAILGHVFPVYLRFRGGKGVATTFGALTALSWQASLAAGAVWLVVFLFTRTVSLASIAAALAFPVAMLAAFHGSPPAVAAPMVFLSAGVAALIIVRHSSNIRRLLAGREARS